MKFGKLLQDFNADSSRKRQRDTGGSPAQLESCFLDYKQMKKILKKAAECKDKGDQAGTKQLEKQFVDLLHGNLERINAHFIEAEEDAVIKMQNLRDEHEAACQKRASQPSVDDATWLATPAVRSMRSRFVDLHGELVLLLHWSIMNYAGTLKILKKHDKLLGGHSQQGLLGAILSMPFTSTSSITDMASSAEMYVKRLGGKQSPADEECGSARKKGGPSIEELERAESLRELMDEAEKWAKEKEGGNPALLGKTRAALAMLNELQTSAHSPSTLNHAERAAVQASVQMSA